MKPDSLLSASLSSEMDRSTRSLLLPGNSYPLTLQGSAIVLGPLPSAGKPLNVPHTSVTLNLLQPPYCKSIESPLETPKRLTKYSTKKKPNITRNQKKH